MGPRSSAVSPKEHRPTDGGCHRFPPQMLGVVTSPPRRWLSPHTQTRWLLPTARFLQEHARTQQLARHLLASAGSFPEQTAATQNNCSSSWVRLAAIRCMVAADHLQNETDRQPSPAVLSKPSPNINTGTTSRTKHPKPPPAETRTDEPAVTSPPSL